MFSFTSTEPFSSSDALAEKGIAMIDMSKNSKANFFLIVVALIDAHRYYIIVDICQTTLNAVCLFFAGRSAVDYLTLYKHGDQRRMVFQYRKLTEFSRESHGIRIAFENDFLR